MNISRKVEERQLFVKLHEILNIFRTIFSNDKSIIRSIDDSYEKILITDLKMVPVQYDEDILRYVKWVTLIVTNVNFANILAGMKEIDPDYKSMGFETNSLIGFENFLGKMQMERSDRYRINNILVKLRPIFACVDKVFATPYNTLQSVVHMTSNKYDDLL